MKKTLMWNDRNVEEEGIKIISLPPIQLSTPRVAESTVQGRDGFLTETDGYDGDTKQVEADYRGANPLRVANWLKGNGEVVFGNLPDRFYKARINNIIPISQIIEKQFYNFPIEFRCQPFGYLLEGKQILTLKRKTVLNNNKATYISKPIITIFGTGACTFSINSRTFKITEIGTSITINSDTEEVLNEKGDKMEGYFPYLDVGENVISWSGNVTKCEIQCNWRCL
jgi:phage-related protein